MKIIPKVKICCISSVEEAQLAIHCGASALGLVSSMPSGPGVISEELIAEIIASVPQHVSTFLLTSKQDVHSIIAQQQKTKANTLQIVDAVNSDVYFVLREKLRGVSLVQVIHVIDESSIEEAKFVSQFVDYILLDSGNPKLTVKELGGTGRKHNWNISKAIVDEVSIPVFLAGGLNPENVQEAVEFVHPYGLDVCNGVRTDGKLDAEKLERFINAISK
jgi:phosphoribosylanthranilate isomerase